MFVLRRLLHSIAYFLAMVAVMALFVLVLMVAESLLYLITGHPVSVWAMVLAATSAAFGFAPLAQMLQRWLDKVFFRQHMDSLAAIRHLGAGDLAQLPIQDIEPALLARICKVSLRRYVALDERRVPEGRLHVYPTNAPQPAEDGAGDEYELRLPLPRGGGEAYLSFGPRNDGWPTDPEEIASLQSLARFAAMSLEHARLTHQQAEAARLDSLSRVTKQLHSHDLKNRLHDLAFLAHHLESGALETEDVQRLVGAIRKVTGRMQMLMQRLSDPRAPLNPAIAPLDLVSLLNGSLRDRLWPEGISVKRNIPPLPPAAGDGELLHSVFDNLYDNAVQAMQGKGELAVAAGVVKREGERWIEVRVRDTGQGIDPDFLQQRLFRLFGTSKPNGLGVGLFLSRRILLAHGGMIAAESPGLGKGCTFIVRLPLWQDVSGSGTEDSA